MAGNGASSKFLGRTLIWLSCSFLVCTGCTQTPARSDHAEAGTSAPRAATGKGRDAAADASSASDASSSPNVAILTCVYAAMPHKIWPPCSFCACSNDLADTMACNGEADCWALLACAARECASIDPAGQLDCIEAHCAGWVGGSAAAHALAGTLANSCTDGCFTEAADSDAGR